MARTGETLKKALPVLLQMPDDVYFDTDILGRVSFQPHTQEEVALIKSFFPGLIWKRTWNKGLNWWEYETEWNGIKVNLYAVHEAPPMCRAITERRMVTKRIPTEFKEVTEETEVIVGWECKGEKDESA